MDHIVAEHGEFEFKRCPVTYIGTREQYLASLLYSGFFKGASHSEKIRMPSKLYEAMLYGSGLLADEELKRYAD